MNDLISRSAVLDRLEMLRRNYTLKAGYRDAMTDAIGEVRGTPAIDAVPVVHAHWIKTFGSDGFVTSLRCSKCGNAENSTYIPGNFCWFCGARMDGESEEEG